MSEWGNPSSISVIVKGLYRVHSLMRITGTDMLLYVGNPQTAQRFGRAEWPAELMRGMWKSSAFTLTEVNKKIFKPEYIGFKSKPGELKHLSTRRKGYQRNSVSSGERTRIRPVTLLIQSETLGTACHSG